MRTPCIFRMQRVGGLRHKQKKHSLNRRKFSQHSATRSLQFSLPEETEAEPTGVEVKAFSDLIP